MRKRAESGRIVIVLDSGESAEINGKGSATDAMFTAFYCLPADRREALLTRMQERHAEMLAESGGTHG